MAFNLLLVLVAFAGGCMGAVFGCLLAFIFVPLVIAGGLGAMGSPEILGILGFGGWGFYAPQISFAGGAFASAYAKWKGYLQSGQDITTALISLKKPDVILLGGVGGLLGYLCMILHANFLTSVVDGVPFGVVVPALIAKIIFDGCVFGKVPDEVKAAGGRYSVRSPVQWIPYVTTGWEKTLLGLVMGIGGAYCTVLLAGNPNTAPWAAFVPFMVAVFSLIGFYFGVAIAPNHHIVYSASLGVLYYVAYAHGGAGALLAVDGVQNPEVVTGCMLWGVSLGVMATFWADFGARTFHLFGNKIGGVHFDPPTQGIFFTSIFAICIFRFAYVNPVLSVVVPVLILAVAVILSIADQVSLKKANA
ncbi:MAG: hypothetical protein FWH38_00750 [Treponema sp.]|nr:hypothetical protein [Treponema sp.]